MIHGKIYCINKYKCMNHNFCEIKILVNINKFINNFIEFLKIGRI